MKKVITRQLSQGRCDFDDSIYPDTEGSKRNTFYKKNTSLTDSSFNESIPDENAEIRLTIFKKVTIGPLSLPLHGDPGSKVSAIYQNISPALVRLEQGTQLSLNFESSNGSKKEAWVSGMSSPTTNRMRNKVLTQTLQKRKEFFQKDSEIQRSKTAFAPAEPSDQCEEPTSVHRDTSASVFPKKKWVFCKICKLGNKLECNYVFKLIRTLAKHSNESITVPGYTGVGRLEGNDILQGARAS